MRERERFDFKRIFIPSSFCLQLKFRYYQTKLHQSKFIQKLKPEKLREIDQKFRNKAFSLTEHSTFRTPQMFAKTSVFFVSL